MSKRKGMNAERELIHKFWATPNWIAVRIAGSGSMRYPAPDIIAGDSSRKLVIECKISKSDNIYIPHKEIEQLQIFAAKFDAEAIIAYRFEREEWNFIDPFKLDRTKKNVVINDNSRGISFEKLIEN